MKVRVLFNISVAIGLVLTAACAPKNTYKTKKFGGEVVFVEDLNAQLLASPEEISDALALKSFQAPTKPEDINKLNAIREKLKTEKDLLIPDEELMAAADKAFTQPADHIIIHASDTGLSAKVKSLIPKILYRLEITDGSISVPAVVIRKQLAPIENLQISENVSAVTKKLKNRRLELYILSIRGESDYAKLYSSPLLQIESLPAVPELLTYGQTNRDGKLESNYVSEIFKEAKVDSIIDKTESNYTLNVSQLFNEPLLLELREGSNSVGNISFKSVGIQLTKEDIEKIKTNLR